MSHKETERVCIKARKVYDWVTRQIDVSPKNMCNTDLEDLFVYNGDDHDSANIADLLCDKDHKIGPLAVECYLSDEKGRKIDVLASHHHRHHKGFVCKEIEAPGGRPEVEVEISPGVFVTLQRVKVIIKGYVTVQLVDGNGRVRICSKAIPFATIQSFLLCAPEGTELDCHVTFFECDSNLILTDGLGQLDVSLTLCLDVQMEADVKLEIEARVCRARDEIIEGLICPPKQFPEQCPDIFPAHSRKPK